MVLWKPIIIKMLLKYHFISSFFLPCLSFIALKPKFDVAAVSIKRRHDSAFEYSTRIVSVYELHYVVFIMTASECPSWCTDSKSQMDWIIMIVSGTGTSCCSGHSSNALHYTKMIRDKFLLRKHFPWCLRKCWHSPYGSSVSTLIPITTT